jgi:AcrR family transcriptional regulator
MTVSTVSVEETRSRLIACGRSLLAESGLRALTTNAVAERARISKKTLYRCFATKDELVDSVILSFIEENLARWDAALDDERTPVMERIQRSLDYVSHLLPQIQAQVLNQVGTGSVPPKLWEKIDAIRLKRLAKFKKLMEEAQAEGYVRGDVDPDHWLLLLMGTVQSVLVPSVLLERGIPLPDIVQTVKTIYSDGLLTQKGRRYVARRRKEEM